MVQLKLPLVFIWVSFHEVFVVCCVVYFSQLWADVMGQSPSAPDPNYVTLQIPILSLYPDSTARSSKNACMLHRYILDEGIFILFVIK